ncbi:MAG: DUF805 domain-containing protein [Rhodomicrobium sp.]
MERASFVLFEFKGRINRLTWLAVFAALIVAESLAEALFRQVFGMTGPAGPGAAPSLTAYFEDRAVLLAGLIFLWPSLALDVKRWHDMGRSGWLTLIAYGPIAAIYVLQLTGLSASLATSERLGSGLFSFMGVVFLVYLVLLAARRGSPAANRYGPA